MLLLVSLASVKGKALLKQAFKFSKRKALSCDFHLQTQSHKIVTCNVLDNTPISKYPGMRSMSRMRKSWQTMRIGNWVAPTRGSILRSFVIVLLVISVTYLLFSPIFFLLKSIGNLFSRRNDVVFPEPGDEQVDLP